MKTSLFSNEVLGGAPERLKLMEWTLPTQYGIQVPK